MKPILTYSDNSDQELYLQTDIHLTNKTLHVLAATIASSPEKPNEDAFAVAFQDNIFFAGIFDGATSLKPIKSLGTQTGARFASHLLKDNFSLLQCTTPKELLIKLNQKLLQTSLQFEGASLTDTHTLPSSTGTIIKIDSGKNELSFAHISDSYGIIYYKDGHSVVFTNDRNSKFDDKIFTLIAHIAKEKGISPRQARDDEEVKKTLIEMYNKRNNNPNGQGCGVINGDPQVEQYIQSQTFSLQDIKTVLIGTDGLIPIGWSEKEENDRQKILNEILRGEFKRLFKTKHESEEADPDWQHIRYKHSDDATGLLVEL